MKKLLALLSALFILSAFLFACNTQNGQPSETTPETAPPAKDFVFFSDDAYACKFIVPSVISSTERVISEALAAWFEEKTGKPVEYLNNINQLKSGEPAVLIGKIADDPISKAAYKTLAKRQGLIRIEDNRLVIAFDNEKSGKAVITQMTEALNHCEASRLFLKGDWKAEFTASPSRDDLPVYSKGAVKKGNADENTLLFASTGSTLEDFEKYCDKVAETGFTKASSRDTDQIYSVTFFGDEDYVYAYYVKSTKTVRVLSGPKNTYGDENCKADTGVTATPSLTVIGQVETVNCGQGYVLLLPDGRLIIHDGGYWYGDDFVPDLVYKTIKNIVPDSEKIVIAAWFISHPHDDHSRAFEEFMNKHGADENVTVERVICNFATADMYTYTRSDGSNEDCKWLVEGVYSSTEQYAPAAQIIKAHSGQVFDFGGAKVEVLFTVEDLLPVNQFDYVNSTSMVIRIEIAGQKIILLGDTTHTSGKILEDMYGNALASDMVQIAHHGLWASYPSLYNCINAPVLLWPSQDYTVRDWINDEAVSAALSNAKDLYIAGTGLTTLSLPYTIQNNKQAVLDTVLAPENE